MSEKINELIKSVKDLKYDSSTGTFETDRRALFEFAELIVRECVGLCDQAAEENARTFYTVTETREIGPALVAKGSQLQAEKLSQQIKQHFGVDG